MGDPRAGKAKDIVVKAIDLVKQFGDFKAVNGVNFSISRGECVGLLGPNGAGKTTIVKMIYGFSPLSSGQLEVLGQDIITRARLVKAKTGVVTQEDNLDPDLSVWDNLIVYAGYFQINKVLAKSKADEVLKFMDLTDKAQEVVEHLSGGLKRRLTIGRALINDPELLILDEPTTGLDPYARHIVWQRLRKLKEAGTTMLLTTHYLEEASQLCDRIIIIYKGSILEQGTTEELIERYVGREALEIGGEGLIEVSALAEGCEELIIGRKYLSEDLILYTNKGSALSARVDQKALDLGMTVNYRRLRQTSLEDVFLILTGETLGE